MDVTPGLAAPRVPPASPTPPRDRRRVIAVVAAVVAAVLVVCCCAGVAGAVVVWRTGLLAEPDPASPAPSPVAGPVEWTPLLRESALDDLWSEFRREFTTEHEVEVDLAPLAGELYPGTIEARAAAGDLPDLFPSAGGERLRRKVEQGMVRDLTDDLADVIATLPPGVLTPYTVDGRVYGLPFHVGVVGFWYNRALFAQAGLDPDRPPETWRDYLSAVEELQQAGIVPVAFAGAEDWPALLWYGCLVTRVVGAEGFTAAGQRRSVSEDPGFLEAAQLLAEFVAAEPFQPGYEVLSYLEPGGQVELVATGQAAMELSGTWAPAMYEALAPGGLGDDLGWFPFPTVEGGQGSPGEVYGDVSGFAVGVDAPDATVDLLRFLFSETNYPRIPAAEASLVPVRPGVEVGPGPHRAVQAATVQAAPAVQPFLDAELPQLSGDLIDSAGWLMRGAETPEEMVSRITRAWQRAPDPY